MTTVKRWRKGPVEVECIVGNTDCPMAWVVTATLLDGGKVTVAASGSPDPTQAAIAAAEAFLASLDAPVEEVES